MSKAEQPNAKSLEQSSSKLHPASRLLAAKNAATKRATRSYSERMKQDHTHETRYCLTCRYPLCGLVQHECPECGRQFDPLDPRTSSSYPTGDIRRGLASTGMFMTIGVGFLSGAAFIASALGVDPLILWFGGFITAPCLLILLGIATIPAIPLARRTRVWAFVAVLTLISIVVTDWPFRISFTLHRPALQRYVDSIRSGKTPAATGSVNIGLFMINRVEIAKGNIGLQLTGDTGGGTYLVHRAPGNTWTWYNTNWEKDFGNGWMFVDQD